MTVSELLNRISSRELSEWMAYYQLEPFGRTMAGPAKPDQSAEDHLALFEALAGAGFGTISEVN